MLMGIPWSGPLSFPKVASSFIASGSASSTNWTENFRQKIALFCLVLTFDLPKRCYLELKLILEQNFDRLVKRPKLLECHFEALSGEFQNLLRWSKTRVPDFELFRGGSGVFRFEPFFGSISGQFFLAFWNQIWFKIDIFLTNFWLIIYWISKHFWPLFSQFIAEFWSISRDFLTIL